MHTKLEQLFAEIDSVCAKEGASGSSPPLTGWCTWTKGREMASLVLATRPSIAVEIGVFGGRSLVSQALAMKHLGRGLAIGVDPWLKRAALEGCDKTNRDYWASMDLAGIRDSFLNSVDLLDINDFCTTFVGTNRQFFALMNSARPDPFIDILHIDGNHSSELSSFDHKQFIPLVKPGGYVWVDDPGWTEDGKLSQVEGIMFAMDQAVLIHETVGYLLFFKSNSADSVPDSIRSWLKPSEYWLKRKHQTP